MRRQLLADLVAQAADGGVVEVGRQLQGLVTAIGGDVLALAAKIALIAGVDRQLLGNLARNAGKLRP